MKIQSLSILVPTKGCVNKCKFCVSCMHENKYEKYSLLDYDFQFKKRLKFARDNNCNTAMLTGTGEALQNIRFLMDFAAINQSLPNPFLWIELQTSGVMLTDENLAFLKYTIGVDTISLSLSNVFDSKRNTEICGTSEKLAFDIDVLCKKIKEYGFNLRLSLNMTKDYDEVSPSTILDRARELGANQITFRKLYFSAFSENNEEAKVDMWVRDNKMNNMKYGELRTFIKNNSEALEVLPFGATKYSNSGMGIVLDEDCMSKEVKDTYKYLILREDCHLYSRWDDKGSLIL